MCSRTADPSCEYLYTRFNYIWRIKKPALHLESQCHIIVIECTELYIYIRDVRLIPPSSRTAIKYNIRVDQIQIAVNDA